MLGASTPAQSALRPEQLADRGHREKEAPAASSQARKTKLAIENGRRFVLRLGHDCDGTHCGGLPVAAAQSIAQKERTGPELGDREGSQAGADIWAAFSGLIRADSDGLD